MEDVFMGKYSVGSLFAGIGGICKGFQNAGFELKWANEFDKNAEKTYKENFRHKFYSDDIHDLVNYKIKSLEKVDVVTSGFPCQAFSIAGYRKGFEDARGNLFFETMKVIKELQPKAFLLENVRNLIAHDSGKTFKIIKDVICDHNYSFIPRVLNSMEYGNVPQTRERIYIVGFKDEAGYENYNPKNVCSNYFNWPEPLKLTKKIQTDILERERVEDKYYYGPSTKYYKTFQKASLSPDTVYQWRRVYLRENKKGMCPTLTANMGMGGHNVPIVVDRYGVRKLTPLECARLQGYDDIRFPEIANSHLYKQMGNSVTVSVIERIADGILKSLDQKYKAKERKISRDTVLV